MLVQLIILLIGICIGLIINTRRSHKSLLQEITEKQKSINTQNDRLTKAYSALQEAIHEKSRIEKILNKMSKELHKTISERNYIQSQLLILKKKNTATSYRKQAGDKYERFIGQYLEKQGFSVIYHGQLKGFCDHGIDLIFGNETYTFVAQCKNWNFDKYPLSYKPILYLMGSFLWFYKTFLYNDWGNLSSILSEKEIKPVLILSHQLKNHQLFSLAKSMGIYIRHIPLYETGIYPKIAKRVNDPSNTNTVIHYSNMNDLYDRVIANLEKNPTFHKRIVLPYFNDNDYYLLVKYQKPTKMVERFFQTASSNINADFEGDWDDCCDEDFEF